MYKNKLGLEEWPNFKACTSTLLSCRDYKLPVLLFKAEQIQIRLTVLFYQAWSASHTFFSEKYHPCNLEVYLEEYSRQMQPPLTASVALCVFVYVFMVFIFGTFLAHTFAKTVKTLITIYAPCIAYVMGQNCRRGKYAILSPWC